MTQLNDGTKHLTSHIMHGTISYGPIYWSRNSCPLCNYLWWFLNNYQSCERLWIHKPPFSRWLWRHKFQRPWKILEMKTQSLSCIVNLLQTICFEFMRFIELSLSKSFVTSNLKRHSPLWHLWSLSFGINWKNIWTLLYNGCAHKISSLRTFSLFKLLL
jgi:hypothetical protein